LAKQMASISKQARENAFNPEFIEKETNAFIKLLPKNSPTLTPIHSDVYKSYLLYRDSPNHYSKFSPFYFNVASALFDLQEHDKAVRVISNLAEIELDNSQFLRLITFKLEEQGLLYNTLTIEILRRVLKLRPEEPHSFLYLSYALIRNAKQLLSKDSKGHRGDLTGVLFKKEKDNDISVEEIAKMRLSEAIDPWKMGR